MKKLIVVLAVVLIFTLTACQPSAQQGTTPPNVTDGPTDPNPTDPTDPNPTDPDPYLGVELTQDEQQLLQAAFNAYVNRKEGEEFTLELVCISRFGQVYAAQFATDFYSSDTEAVTVTVAGYSFAYGTGTERDHILICSEGKLYTMPDAFAAGIITEENVATIHADWTRLDHANAWN